MTKNLSQPGSGRSQPETKTLIITGASRGIGRAAAEQFSAAGWRVINLSRTPCDLPTVIHIECDLANSETLSHSVQELKQHLLPSQHICVLHNSAHFYKDDALNIDAAELRRMLEVNIIAPTQLNKQLRPFMAPGSSIIYIGSTLSHKAVANTASYVVTKHAVAGLMRATCQDLCGVEIHTCCICPGFTLTEMMQNHLAHHPEVAQMVKAKMTQGRFIEPHEIAEVCLFAALHPVFNGAMLDAHLGQIET